MKKMCMYAAAAAMFFTSCSKENDGPIPVIESDADVAYVSIKIATEGSRAGSSSEDAGKDENAIKSLYLITFNSNNLVEAIPGTTPSIYSKEIITTSTTPAAQMISANSKNLVVIANPGTKLKAAITGLNGQSTFAAFNVAITAATLSDIVADDKTSFAMITSGDGEGKVVDNQILNPFVAIGDKLVKVTDTMSDADAKKEAEDNKRLPVKLERFAAKLVVNTETTVSVKDNDKFSLKNWTVDAVNSRYYPFAEKTLMAGHTGSSYANAFYTKDPNYTGNTGIMYGTVVDYEPVLPLPYKWENPGAIAYVIENTMDKGSQTFANATRLVLKATYSPKAYNEGEDWFSFEGNTYQTLEDLQKAYKDDNATTALKNACVHFYGRIRSYYVAKGATLAAADFTSMTQAELTSVPGGEVVKDGTTSVIFWYKGAVCYYYYEIRHDNDPNIGTSAQNKYGVVRNNWYNLTLNSVSGPGTPWYPDINKPGPGDPDPNDPIDTQSGYLGITVNIAPWILRDVPFVI